MWMLLSFNVELRDVFKELLHLASQWKSIGILLGIQMGVLNKIKVDEGDDCNLCLATALSEWLKQVNPPPSWNNLADVIETVDRNTAAKLREHAT